MGAKLKTLIFFIWFVLATSKAFWLGGLDQALCTCERLTRQARILNASLVGEDDLRWLASIYSIDNQLEELGNYLLGPALKGGSEGTNNFLIFQSLRRAL